MKALVTYGEGVNSVIDTVSGAVAETMGTAGGNKERPSGYFVPKDDDVATMSGASESRHICWTSKGIQWLKTNDAWELYGSPAVDSVVDMGIVSTRGKRDSLSSWSKEGLIQAIRLDEARARNFQRGDAPQGYMPVQVPQPEARPESMGQASRPSPVPQCLKPAVTAKAATQASGLSTTKPAPPAADLLSGIAPTTAAAALPLSKPAVTVDLLSADVSRPVSVSTSPPGGADLLTSGCALGDLFADKKSGEVSFDPLAAPPTTSNSLFAGLSVAT